MLISQEKKVVRHLFLNVHPKYLNNSPTDLGAFTGIKILFHPKNEVTRPKEEAKPLCNSAKLTPGIVFE